MNYYAGLPKIAQASTERPFCAKRLSGNPRMDRCHRFLESLEQSQARQCPHGFCAIRLSNYWLCGFGCEGISDEKKMTAVCRQKEGKPIEYLSFSDINALPEIDKAIQEQDVFSYYFHDISHTVGILKTHIEQCEKFSNLVKEISEIIHAYDETLAVYQEYQNKKKPKVSIPQDWFKNHERFSTYLKMLHEKNEQSLFFMNEMKKAIQKAIGLIDLANPDTVERQITDNIQLHEFRSLRMMTSLFDYRIDFARECWSLIKGDEMAKSKKVDINISSALYKLVMFMKTPAHDRGLNGVFVDGPDSCFISTVDSVYLGFYILLENAVKYAVDQTKVHVFIASNGPGKASVTFQNKSDPITPESMDRLEENGFSGENSINKESHGFGLSIVKRIFDQAGAEVTYSYDEKTSFFEARVVFP